MEEAVMTLYPASELRTLAGYHSWAPVHQKAFDMALGEYATYHNERGRTQQQVKDQDRLYAFAEDVERTGEYSQVAVASASIIRSCAGLVGQNP